MKKRRGEEDRAPSLTRSNAGIFLSYLHSYIHPVPMDKNIEVHRSIISPVIHLAA